MKKFIALSAVALISVSAFAARVGGQATKKVTVSKVDGIWTEQTSSEANGTKTILIPVSEAAFDHLASLDSKATYECEISKSTVEQQGTDQYWEAILIRHYVISINCL